MALIGAEMMLMVQDGEVIQSGEDTLAFSSAAQDSQPPYLIPYE